MIAAPDFRTLVLIAIGVMIVGFAFYVAGDRRP